MKSKAAIGSHPLHPMFVVIPIGGWFAAFVGDLAYAATGAPFWYQFSYYTMLIGLAGALAAAVFGFIDYFGVKMSEAGYRVARVHMLMNLAISAAYALNLWLRQNNGAAANWGWTLAFSLQIASFASLLVSGWLGGKMAYEHKVGVSEHIDPEATQIGINEPAPATRAGYSRSRGIQG